jgi:hypothetical protein
MSILKVDTIQNSVGENLVFGNKNLLINGSQSVWQRSTSESVSTSIYSTVDRFATRVSGMGTFTISRSTDVPSGQGFGYSTKWDCTTADASPATSDFLMMQQIIEGQNLQHLLKGTSSAKKLTLSFWVKSNKTGTYIASLYDGDNTRRISKSYTVSSASTWEKKEITFDGDTTGVLDNDNGASLWVQWWLGAGSDRTSGTLATSWESNVDANSAVGQVNLADSTSNEWYITGCQLEVGSKATDFDFEPYANTLQKCQRYFYFWLFPNSSNGFNDAYQTSLGFNFHPISFPTTMRVAPSVTADLSTDWSTVNASQNVIQIGSKNIAYHKIRASSTGRVYALYTGTTNGAEFDAEL